MSPPGVTFGDTLSVPFFTLDTGLVAAGGSGVGFKLAPVPVPDASPYSFRVRNVTSFVIPVSVLYTCEPAQPVQLEFNFVIDIFNRSQRVHSSTVLLTPLIDATEGSNSGNVFTGIATADLVNSIPVTNPSTLSIGGHGNLPEGTGVSPKARAKVSFNSVLNSSNEASPGDGSFSYNEEDA